jgi:16S rRNA (cytidine1402-2'-O)-methyltransferase
LNIDSSLLLAAAAAAGHQHHPAGTLYVVATPIGNLADITLRAMHVLGRVDAVACEDTRVTGQLLRHLGLHKPLLALHAHNEARGRAAVWRGWRAANRWPLSATPARRPSATPAPCWWPRWRAAGHPVVPLPGPSSALAALSAAGDAAAAGLRLCRLPAGQGRRAARCAEQACGRRPRAGACSRRRTASGPAGGAGEAAPQRQITLCRELTKQFETIHTHRRKPRRPGWRPTRTARGANSCWCCMRCR